MGEKGRTMLKRLLVIIYCVLSVALIWAGIIFEEPYGDRSIILYVLGAGYIGFMIFKVVHRMRSLYSTLFPIVMVFILLGIEIYSKYTVNYFFHTLYLLLIFYVIVSYQSIIGIIISGVITVLSFVKFIQLILIEFTFANISLMVFFGSFQILIVFIGIFLRVYKEKNDKMKVLYDELLESHNQLKIYAKEIKELSQIEARTMIARDLHDTLGHELTGLIMQMEMAASYLEDGDMLESRNMLTASKKSARGSLIQVRQIVETLQSTHDIPWEKSSIDELVNDFANKTSCKIDLEIIGNKVIKPEQGIVLYRVIQESMTNAVRHGKAKHININVEYGEKGVEFIISDDGIGCTNVIESNGLKGMIERLREVKGYIEYDGNKHFIVKGYIPYEGGQV